MERTSKQNLQEQLKRDIQRKHEQLEKLDYIPVNLIKQAFPDGYWAEYFNDFNFTVPMNFAVIDQFLEFMKNQFPEIEMRNDRSYLWGDSNPPAAARCFTFRVDIGNNKHVYFEVDFRSNMKGATCVLNPIGKTTKTVVEYEVVCSQEAANEFTIPS